MQMSPYFKSAEYVHEHVQPEDRELATLKSEVDKHNLTEMWDMILTLDYEVNNVRELSRETREEFCGIVSLLLKAFSK
ncbi:hypothetical protein [Roseibium litorale]|uniref:Uncharacterized protein n=1 Tax=Roseibium litorale TaxID=2803841 RepID=A0ABR9CGB6_9HYPH|nr:hypothetical protein [Roseibium litorale]MBD8889958.1 hypothetical protein [Roseibium litorale]